MYYIRSSHAQKDLFNQTQSRLFASLKYLYSSLESLNNDPRQHQIQQKLQNLETKPASPLLYALNTLLASQEPANIDFCIKALLETNFTQTELIEDTAYFKNNGLAALILEKAIQLDVSNTKPIQQESALIQKINKAIQTIHHYTPLMGCEVDHFMKKVYITSSPKMISGTSFNLFGAIYLGDSLLKEHDIIMSTSIIHEVAHLYFYALSTIDPLIVNDYEEKYPSPLKTDERPLIAVFHAVFVLSRMVNFLKQILNYPKSPLYQEALIEYHKNIAFFEAGYETVSKNAKLTTMGKKFLRDIRRKTS